MRKEESWPHFVAVLTVERRSPDLKSGITGVTAPVDYAPRTKKTEHTMQRKIPSGKCESDVHLGASLPK